MRDSVTVSIGLETSGMRRRMLGVSIVATSQLEGSRSEACGKQQHIVEGQALAKLRMGHWESPYAKKPAVIRGPSTMSLNAAISCSAIA